MAARAVDNSLSTGPIISSVVLASDVMLVVPRKSTVSAPLETLTRLASIRMSLRSATLFQPSNDSETKAPAELASFMD